MKKIAIVTWWENSEREISIKSAKNIENNLDKNKYFVDLFVLPEDKNNFIIESLTYDLIIPVVHGVGWEDWEITSFCKFIWKPYLFTDFQSHILCLNKYWNNKYLESFGILLPKTFLVQNIEDINLVKIPWKIFIKPCNGWSSVDCWVFDDIVDAKSLIEKILEYDEVLVQEYIKKWREFTVTIVGDYNNSPKVFAITEVITQKQIFDYNAKYMLEDTKEIINPEIDTDIEVKIKSISLDIYKRCKIQTLGRIDFILSDWNIYFLEVNTIPWFTATSFVPQAILDKWISISDFLDQNIEKVLLN